MTVSLSKKKSEKLEAKRKRNVSELKVHFIGYFEKMPLREKLFSYNFITQYDGHEKCAFILYKNHIFVIL